MLGCLFHTSNLQILEPDVSDATQLEEGRGDQLRYQGKTKYILLIRLYSDLAGKKVIL